MKKKPLNIYIMNYLLIVCIVTFIMCALVAIWGYLQINSLQQKNNQLYSYMHSLMMSTSNSTDNTKKNEPKIEEENDDNIEYIEVEEEEEVSSENNK